MADVLYHGTELDRASNNAEGGPAAMNICLTALDSRTSALVDSQVESCLSEDAIADTQAQLSEHTDHADRGLAELVSLRSAIGGAYTFGMFVGLELGRLQLHDASEFDADELVQWAERYGHPEEWAQRAKSAHIRAEKAEQRVSELEAT